MRKLSPALLAILLGFVAVNATSQAKQSSFTDEENLVANWSMETSGPNGLPTGWVTPHTDFISRSQTLAAAMHGQAGMEIQATEGSKWAWQVLGGLTVGERYIASANVKVTGDSGVAAILARDTTTNEILGIKRVYPGSYESWQKLIFDFETTSNEVRLFCTVSRTNGSSFFDMMKLYPGDTVLGAGSFEVDDEQWVLHGGASIEETDSLFGSKSLVLTNGIDDEVSFATKALFLSETDHEKAFKLSGAIKTTPALESSFLDWLMYSLQWWYEPYTGLVSDIFVCNQETDWLDNPIDETIILDRNVPEIEGFGAGFQVRAYSADASQFIDLSTPLLYSKSNAFHEREFHFLVPEWTRILVITAVNRKSSMAASFDNIRLIATENPNNKYFHNVGAAYNPVEAPLPGSFLAPETLPDINDAIKLVTDPINPHYGKIIWVKQGIYSGPAIDIWSNLHLKMHPKAFLSRTKDPIILYGFGAGFIRSCNTQFPGTTRLCDIVIEGGVYLSNNHFGNAIALAGNRMIVRNLTIPSWSRKDPEDPAKYQISGMFLFGNDLSIHNNTIFGPTSRIVDQYVFEGFDGIHIWGGSRASILNNTVQAGDDGIGLFCMTRFKVDPPEGFPPDHPIFPIHHFDHNITDIEVYNNRVFSHGARTIGLGIAWPRQDERRLISQVKNIRIRNFYGKCGGGGDLITLNSSPALPYNDLEAPDIPESQVSNILIERGYAEGDFSIESQVPYYDRVKENGIRMVSSDVGSFHNIRFRNVTVKNMTFNALDIQKFGPIPVDNQGIDFRDCIFNAANSEEPLLPHRSFCIDRNPLLANEINADLETANTFLGSPGHYEDN